MDIATIAHYGSTLVMLVYAIVSFCAPKAVATSLETTLTTPRSIAEFRIGNGGFVFGLSAWALLYPSPTAFHLVAAVWFGGAVARVIAYILDKPKGAGYFGLLVLEVVMGALLLI